MKQKPLRVAVALLCAFLLMGAYSRTPPGSVMASAAKNFLASLSSQQQAGTVFPFATKERMNWHYIPRARKGLAFKEMDAAQRYLAHALLSAGLSQRGYLKATTIMSLEKILHELEQGQNPMRDSELYYFSVFGEPSESATWGWRVEGHHLSLNFTLINGRLIAWAPSFFGANPAEVKQGSHKGLRTLAREEDLARELLKSLDQKQRAVAVIDVTAPRDILTRADARVKIAPPKGLPVAQMNQKQTELLGALLEEYAGNMPEELAQARMDRLRKAGLDKIHFAWAGGAERSQPHYYRLQGPTFLIEYDNIQNDANHIHSVWRDFHGDFGRDLLAAHYRESHHHRTAD